MQLETEKQFNISDWNKLEQGVKIKLTATVFENKCRNCEMIRSQDGIHFPEFNTFLQ